MPIFDPVFLAHIALNRTKVEKEAKKFFREQARAIREIRAINNYNRSLINAEMNVGIDHGSEKQDLEMENMQNPNLSLSSALLNASAPATAPASIRFLDSKHDAKRSKTAGVSSLAERVKKICEGDSENMPAIQGTFAKECHSSGDEFTTSPRP